MTAMAYGLELDKLEEFWHYARKVPNEMGYIPSMLWAIIYANNTPKGIIENE